MIRGVVSRMSGSRGQTLIEFAFVAPIMFVFLFGIVDFGIALDRRVVLQHAVADGARRGAVNPDVDETIAYTEDQSQGLLDNTANPGAVIVCFLDDDFDGNLGEVGDSIRVAADFDYNFTVAFGEMMGAFGVSIPSINMTPYAIERLETSAAPGGPVCPPVGGIIPVPTAPPP